MRVVFAGKKAQVFYKALGLVPRVSTSQNLEVQKINYVLEKGKKKR